MEHGRQVLNKAMWRLRRAFWNALVTFKFRHAKPGVVPPPVPEDRPLRLVPFSTKFPRVPIRGLFVADHVPADERQTVKLRFCQLQAMLYRLFSPMQKGLPPIDADPDVALAHAYTTAHKRCYATPLRPAAYEGDVDLGQIAVASPYACYLTREGSDRFHWDLRSLEKFECHPGLRPPIALVEFAFDPSESRLSAVRIDCDYGSCRPGDRDWPEAQRLALCAVATHLSLVRHFNWLHLVAGARMSVATRTCLPVVHPIRRLLWPHVFATESSNQMVTIDQMDVGGDFENIFSFTHGGMCELFEASCGDFDLRMIHPAVDAEQRGLGAVPFETPALANRISIMAVLSDHVSRYLSLYFDSDDAIAQDGPLSEWLDSLAAGVQGAADLAGKPLTIEGTVTLLSTLIYLATVEHEIVGSGVWNYQLWPDVQPVRVYLEGRRQPLDNYQRLVNANFNLNVHRTPLMSDFSRLALDPRGAEAFQRFRLDLSDLQSSMDSEPATPWRMEPRLLKANINA
jgi:arachidonate 15-lipoxygenase